MSQASFTTLKQATLALFLRAHCSGLFPALFLQSGKSKAMLQLQLFRCPSLVWDPILDGVFDNLSFLEVSVQLWSSLLTSAEQA